MIHEQQKKIVELKESEVIHKDDLLSLDKEKNLLKKKKWLQRKSPQIRVRKLSLDLSSQRNRK